MTYLFRERLLLVSTVASLVINIILWLVLFGKFGLGKQPIPLHFNVVYGIDFVGKSYEIYQLPLVGAVIFLINIFLGQPLYKREKMLSRFLGLATLLVQVILAIAVWAILVLNR